MKSAQKKLQLQTPAYFFFEILFSCSVRRAKYFSLFYQRVDQTRQEIKHQTKDYGWSMGWYTLRLSTERYLREFSKRDTFHGLRFLV